MSLTSIEPALIDNYMNHGSRELEHPFREWTPDRWAQSSQATVEWADGERYSPVQAYVTARAADGVGVETVGVLAVRLGTELFVHTAEVDTGVVAGSWDRALTLEAAASTSANSHAAGVHREHPSPLTVPAAFGAKKREPGCRGISAGILSIIVDPHATAVGPMHQINHRRGLLLERR